MELRDVIARNVRRLRHEQGLTQEELAGRTGYSTKRIGLLERSTHSPSVALVAELAEALGVKPWTLLMEPEQIVAATPPPANGSEASSGNGVQNEGA